MTQPAHGGNLVWAAKLAGCPPSAIVDFSASISPLGPPHSVLVAMKSQMAKVRNYPDPNYSELRLALSHFHQLPSEWILPGNGSAELLTLLGREFAQLTATVLMTPAFGDYYRALRSYNANVQELFFWEEEEDKGKAIKFIPPLSDSVTPKTSGLIINNPHNPTGKLFVREAILHYLEEFALVVVDEAFMDFLSPEEEQSLIGLVQKYPNLVILRSLTKFYSLPGLRLGYAIAHPERLQCWRLWRDPWPVNTLAELAGIAAIIDIYFQQQTWAWLPAAREELFQGLRQIPGLEPLPSAANFLLIKSQVSVKKLQSQLLRHHQIFIRDCVSFPELGDRFFRIAVRTSEENQLLLDALNQVIIRN